MKAEQSSLYRHLEALHLWSLDTFENVPKNTALQTDVRLVIENIVQAQTAVAMALMADNLKQRADFLDIVEMNITNIKTITKVLTEYSSKVERGIHVISKKGRVKLLDIISQIGEELGRWRNKTLQQIKTADTTMLPK